MNYAIFDKNIDRLENIFGKAVIALRRKRLKEIFENTERTWHENLIRLKNQKVENVLIAEAPPWSESGTIPRYFYNKIESKYHQNIWRAFYPYNSVPSDKEQSYRMLADKKFLLVDTVPFSMRYSSTDRRSSSYLEIVINSLGWWTGKLTNENLLFANKVKVAFAFKLNGLAVIRATGGQIKLGNDRLIKLTENLIAADGSGYTNSDTLQKIFEL